MNAWRRWRERRRWRKQPPREAWVVLLDSDGREVTHQVPVTLAASEPGEFSVEAGVTFRDIAHDGVATFVRVIDADGQHHDKPIP